MYPVLLASLHELAPAGYILSPQVPEQHVLIAVSALQALLPPMQSVEVAGGWKLLSQQVRWVQERLSQQMTSRDPTAVAAAGGCASCLLELLERGARALQRSRSSCGCGIVGRGDCADDADSEICEKEMDSLINDILCYTCCSTSVIVQEVHLC
jgi:hypothetical protein